MDEQKEYTREELEKKLTKKQKIFCHEYIIDWNASRASRVAGYSDTYARQTAHENHTKPYIVQYINLIKDDIAKEAGISKLMIVNELKKFAFNSFDQIHDTWIGRKDFDKLPTEVKACIQEIDSKVVIRMVEDAPVEVVQIKIKLVDKRGALADLTKMMGWNEPEAIIVGGAINTNSTVTFTNYKKKDEPEA